MYDVVIYRSELGSIGGIETWAINLAKRYGKTHKMAVAYGMGAHETIRDLAQHVETIKYAGQPIKTRTAIFCYDFMGFETCEAEEKIHAIHADYGVINLPIRIPEGVDKFVAVSETARQGFAQVSKNDSQVVYNPVEIGDTSKIIRLVSGTRLTSEKGLTRMVDLAHALDRLGVFYEWHIFTNYNQQKPFSPSVIFRSPTRKLLSYAKDADYLVQLSDTESYGFSIVESLAVGTPVVVTDIAVLPELGVSEKNAIIVPLEKANYEVIAQKIANSKLKFSYTPPADKWDDIFGKGSGNDYEYKPLLLRNRYGGLVTLVQEGIDLPHGETVLLFDQERADSLVKLGYLEYVEK